MDKIIQLIKGESTFFTGWLDSKKLGLALIYSLACSLAGSLALAANPWAAAAIFFSGALVVIAYVVIQGLTEREAVKSTSGKAPPAA